MEDNLKPSNTRRQELQFYASLVLACGLLTLILFFGFATPAFFDLLHIIANGEFPSLQPMDIITGAAKGGLIIVLLIIGFAATWAFLNQYKKLRRERR